MPLGLNYDLDPSSIPEKVRMRLEALVTQHVQSLKPGEGEQSRQVAFYLDGWSFAVRFVAPWSTATVVQARPPGAAR